MSGCCTVTHESEKITSSREIHVGLDAWNLAPVAISDVENLMKRMMNTDLTDEEQASLRRSMEQAARGEIRWLADDESLS